ncbi:MAG: LytTR family transcriptional regulator DNA-binding domain-containing protein [Bacteroidota bacterium]
MPFSADHKHYHKEGDYTTASREKTQSTQQKTTDGGIQPTQKSSSDYKVMILEKDLPLVSRLVIWLKRVFPEIQVVSVIPNISDIPTVFSTYQPDLIFCKATYIQATKAFLDETALPGIISLSESPEDAIKALRQENYGFISLPLKPEEASLSIRCALKKIERYKKQLLEKTERAIRNSKLIGIPTIDGLEFINSEDIIRCEGLQKCTLIITTARTPIISSYSIGKFRELLKDCGFFPCHRSHHINLKFVKKYSREGYIFFTSESKPVPLSRRRKSDFLHQIRS